MIMQIFMFRIIAALLIDADYIHLRQLLYHAQGKVPEKIAILN
jgi:hypothetical protein